MRKSSYRIWFQQENKMLYKGALTFNLSDNTWIWKGRHGSISSDFGETMEGTGIEIMVKVKGSSIKQSKELFEGDIIKCFDDEIVTIVWNEEIAGFDTEPKIKYSDYGWSITISNRRSKIELLGNIYENPDLIND